MVRAANCKEIPLPIFSVNVINEYSCDNLIGKEEEQESAAEAAGGKEGRSQAGRRA